LTSIAYYGETAPNGFAARWNGSTLYTQTNLEAFGWTNLQFVVPATAGSATLEFVFNNTPAAFGLDDIQVQPAPVPVLQAAAMSGGLLTFTWSAIPNLSYQVQSATNLGQPNWTDAGAAVIARGDVVSASEPAGVSAQQFYRVILLPSP
jgi:hypothetical protein